MTLCAEAASENTAALAHMRRSPSTFFDRAEAAASYRPEAQINVPDIFANASILPQRLTLCCQVISFTYTMRLPCSCMLVIMECVCAGCVE